MPGLKELQAAFRRSVVLGRGEILNLLAGSQTVSSELRLAVYENAYRSRLEEAMAADCPILQKLLGEDDFSSLCQGYIDSHPSRFFSLRWFSGEFARHLGYDAIHGGHSWEAEMAQLELSFVDAFDAADHEVLTETDAAKIPPEAWPQLRVKFHPSVSLTTLYWNSLNRWRAAKHDEVDPGPQRLVQQVSCLMWRQGISTQYRSLESLETGALHAAMCGADFAEICGALAEDLREQEQVPLQAAGFLKQWLSSGMIAGLSF